MFFTLEWAVRFGIGFVLVYGIPYLVYQFFSKLAERTVILG